ncbi:MAG: outer membrane protein transport protein [Planctomycetaceae bacterium]|nr:outer membrane protein transport protein [Planctomycetaceae bacterium]
MSRFLQFLLVTLAVSSSAFGQGIIAPTAGPINSSMAGASVAAPIDFGGSYWNPAILSGLPRNEFLLGSQLLIPSLHLTSRLPAGAINGVFPPTSRFGVARSDSGVASNLATGVSFRLRDDSPTTWGIGVFGLVGGGVNYAGSNTVPILTPRQPPNFFGVGPIYASTSFLAIMLTGSQQVTDRLAIGGGPMIVTGPSTFEPAFFAPGPRDATGLLTFPPATNSRPFWGAGFQIGLLYNLADSWNIGFSYKSPIWQERYGYNSYNPNFSARRIGIQGQEPEIFSWGVAYKGFERALIDVDFRYFDYANTSLYGTKPINGGLGWSSIFALAIGGQYQATDRLTGRAGYLYNTNPIKATDTLFNAQAPGFLQQMLALGVSYKLTEDIALSLAWTHQFRNSIEGPILQIPGARVKLDAQIDSIVVGLNIQFGAPKVRPDNSVSSGEVLQTVTPNPPIPPPATAPSAAPVPVSAVDSGEAVR